jgi:hypothetical protein
MQWIRMFNEEEGVKLLAQKGVKKEIIEKLPWIGISGAANIVASIKYAKYFELNENDIVVTILTDSIDMYRSRLAELNEEKGKFDAFAAHETGARFFDGIAMDFVKELNYYDRKAVHNLKYYTWVEQQGKTYDEIVTQWEDDSYWTDIPKHAARLDELITEFNKKVAEG